MAVIKAINQKEARYWFHEGTSGKVITDIKRGGFSHIDECDGKRVYNYHIKWRKSKR